MSATLPNLDLLADWLDAALFVTNYRPVPLTHKVLFNGTLYDENMKSLRKLPEDLKVTVRLIAYLPIC